MTRNCHKVTLFGQKFNKYKKLHNHCKNVSTSDDWFNQSAGSSQGVKEFKYKHLRNIKEEESDGYGNGKLQVLPIPEEIG